MSSIMQRDQARERANEVRARRAAEHHRIRALPTADAHRALGHLIAENPGWIHSAPVHVLLGWLPGDGLRRSGLRKVNRILFAAGIYGVQRTGNLAPTQRRRLVALLGGDDR